MAGARKSRKKAALRRGKSGAMDVLIEGAQFWKEHLEGAELVTTRSFFGAVGGRWESPVSM